MKSVREVMRDPRAAVAVAALAVLLVAYRVLQHSPPAAGSQPASERELIATQRSAEQPDAPGSIPGDGPGHGTAPDPTQEVRWLWTRNPFLRVGDDLVIRTTREASRAAPPDQSETSRGSAEPSMTLRGTVASEANVIAILGNRVAAVGDIVNGWTVVAVEHRRVVIRSGTAERTLELPKPASLDPFGGNAGARP